MSDISVSRCHALIKFNSESGRYYLEDNLSKFGTLVLAKGTIDLDVDMTKAVQIGRSVVSFTVKTYVPQPPQNQVVEMKQNNQVGDNQIYDKQQSLLNQIQMKTPSPTKQI